MIRDHYNDEHPSTSIKYKMTDTGNIIKTVNGTPYEVKVEEDKYNRVMTEFLASNIGDQINRGLREVIEEQIPNAYLYPDNQNGKIKVYNNDGILILELKYDPVTKLYYSKNNIITGILDNNSIKITKGANQLVKAAQYELSQGFKENNADNMTPYGEWYGLDGQPWCAMFVSYCAQKAGLLDNLVPRFASVNSGIKWYKEHNRYKSIDSEYEPKAGDIIFFESNGQKHTGIVTAFDSEKNMVYTIEGNSDNAVANRKYSLNNSKIIGYGFNGGMDNGIIPENASSGSSTTTR